MSFKSFSVRHQLPVRFSTLVRLLCLWSALAAFATPGYCADPDEEFDLVADPDDTVEESSDSPKMTPVPRGSVVEDGPGVIGNVGFLGLKTFGREDSIAPVEVLPYLLLDEDFIFSDVRGLISTEGRFGGNFGVGYRRLVPNQNAWYGVNAWYDVDDTSSQLFHQLGLGVEAVFQSFEFRGNAYFPVGNTSQTLDSDAINARFVNQQIVFDQRVLNGYALRGVDAEVGYSLAVPRLGEHTVVRGFAGGYFFSGSGQSESINGVKARAEAQIATTVTTHVQFTKDDEYGSNVMVGVSLDLPFGESHPTANWRRNTPTPFRFVQRNYNVILDRRDESKNGLVAINPRTGQAYRVAHVDTTFNGTGTGDVDTPFDDISSAGETGADILFVHAGSTISEGIQLADGQTLLGDAGEHWIDLPGGSSARLPSLNDGSDAPRITGIVGDAVTLGSGSSISGFQIEHIQGNGIVGTHVTDGAIRNVTLSDISGDGVRLTDVSGTFRLTDLTMADVQGSGIVVTGGGSDLIVQRATLDTINDDAIRLQSITDGMIQLLGFTAQNVGGSGLAMNEVDADVTTSNLSITDSDDAAISITGGEGTYLFQDTTTLDEVAGGVSITDSIAPVTFQFLDVATNTSAPAVFLDNATGDLQFDALVINSTTGPGMVARDVEALTISDGLISTAGAAAFDAEDSNFDVILGSVSVDDGPVGIRLVDATGSFVVSGPTGGTIKNTDTGVLINNAGTVYLRTMQFQDNGTAISSRGAELLGLRGVTVTGSTGYAVDSLNDELVSIQTSTFSANGAVDGGTIRVQVDKAGTYRSEFLSNTISDTVGTPLRIANSGPGVGATLDTTISGNSIVATRGGRSGIDILWNGPAGLTVSGNTFTMSGSAMTGVRIETPSATDSLTANILSNTMSFSGSSSIGVNVIASAESNLQVQTNQISFSGIGGTGLRFEMTGETSTWLAANSIIDTGSGATGINFVKVADLSRVQLDSNSIQLQSASSAIDRGIIFGTIDGTVQLFGTLDNTVTGATDPFFIPTGRSTGGFPVNGVLVP